MKIPTAVAFSLPEVAILNWQLVILVPWPAIVDRLLVPYKRPVEVVQLTLPVNASRDIELVVLSVA